MLFELSLATTMTVLKPVSCDHVTSFNYDGKKAMDVGLTCWSHLTNIMPDSSFPWKHEAGDNLFFFFFLRGDTSVFLRMKEMESVLSL